MDKTGTIKKDTSKEEKTKSKIEEQVNECFVLH